MKTNDPQAAGVRRTVRFEVVLAVAVVAVTAVLSQLPPGAYVVEAQAKPAVAQSVTVTGSDFGTTVRVRLTITPGSVGPNAFVAHVNDFDTGKPVPATSVGLSFSLSSRPDIAASTLPLKRSAPGVWSAQGANLSIDGTWSVTVQIQEATGAVEVPMKVRTRLPPEQITVSNVPGQPTLYTIAVPGGGTLQTYVDPGKAGINQVHFTFFKADGSEQPITSATATSVSPSQREAPLPLTRFDPGHFIANTTLIDGRWTFKVKAVTTDGRPISAYFSHTIGGS
jgi:nitrogen fixation protein FixH